VTPRAAAASIQWIRVGVAARILQVTPRMVRYHIEEGLLRARRFGRRGWREVPRADVERLARERAA